ncbi:DUF4397 domain-containing protein [Shewanella algidipiscicola]|uniref:DUF4397 domain-containing protein n=1 Tax=Shewanella algidipiscicola TaxID=614070 RepID=A0ABQ4PFL4_9GAMM|nr:DUF4397 domain-containing protein [Shewanella algidipiscicola]GIU46360.1 hypothetical protein TUM4630_16660 [Shewanella algidipiscicola]
MKRIYPAILLSTSVMFGLSACNDDDDDIIKLPEPMLETQVRVIHAGVDAPKVNVNANGAALLTDVDYAVSSGFTTVPVDTYAIGVDAQLADGSVLEVLTAELDAMAEMQYTAVAVGKVTDDTLQLKLIANAVSDIATDYARVQVLHGASDVGLVDIYVTAPGVDITSQAPTLSANFLDVSDQLEILASDYQIRITASGQKTPVFDSGTVPLQAGNDYLISAIPNAATGDSPVALLVALDDAQLVLQDTMTGSDVRAIHAVADAPAVDIFLNGAATPAVDMLSFSELTDYLNVPDGDHTITVAADADNSLVVIDAAPVTLAQGASYSVLAVGSLSDSDIAPLVVMEDRRRVATEAKLNIIHASYSAGNVDIYLTPSSDITAATPALSNVPFKATSGSLSVPAGDYVVTVTGTGSKTAAIGPLNVTLAAGNLYSVAAVDAANGGTPLGVILMDDFVPAL